MNPYEGMFVLFNKEAQKDHAYLEDHVRALIDKVGGKVVRLGKWDERQLAYEIDGQKEGIFYLCYFEAGGDAIPVLRREASLSELVLRLLVLRLDKVPTEEEERHQSGRHERASEEAGEAAARPEGGDETQEREEKAEAAASSEE